MKQTYLIEDARINIRGNNNCDLTVEIMLENGAKEDA